MCGLLHGDVEFVGVKCIAFFNDMYGLLRVQPSSVRYVWASWGIAFFRDIFVLKMWTLMGIKCIAFLGETSMGFLGVKCSLLQGERCFSFDMQVCGLTYCVQLVDLLYHFISPIKCFSLPPAAMIEHPPSAHINDLLLQAS